ncbi:helix-turn-helix domain-containing protein [Streptomyces sp. NPDC050485]|uniref:helix-turn-helix domain-containing protein n=1 Tax=Streptomyces sp. NPDC050485 TaxID=3365617 RepID=UPI0037A69B53
MASQHLSAPSRASSHVPDRTPRSGGVIHANTRHTTRHTVVGNHLAQHRELSLLAIGLAVHIQSLPAGARISIKALAARFPESEARIAAALRELEAHGYLKRTRERLPSGRVVTRTVSCNQPGADRPVPTVRPATTRPGPAHPSASHPGATRPSTSHPTATRPAPTRPDPLQTCESCDRAFRAPGPGHCRDCRPRLTEAA